MWFDLKWNALNSRLYDGYDDVADELKWNVDDAWMAAKISYIEWIINVEYWRENKWIRLASYG